MPVISGHLTVASILKTATLTVQMIINPSAYDIPANTDIRGSVFQRICGYFII